MDWWYRGTGLASSTVTHSEAYHVVYISQQLHGAIHNPCRVSCECDCKPIALPLAVDEEAEEEKVIVL